VYFCDKQTKMPAVPLKPVYQTACWPEAGCDEAGRGCLAGPVYAAAVILPPDYTHPLLNDSKQLTEKQRYDMRAEIQASAVAWAVGVCTHEEIDRMNILRASIEAMHRAVAALKVPPRFLIIDGNRFTPFGDIPYRCIVKGDALYCSIAAASVLAKTFRDDFMNDLAARYPAYDWLHNKGYPTARHREAIEKYGLTPFHRKSFHMPDPQMKLF
jgi:ribonuclease HII